MVAPGLVLTVAHVAAPDGDLARAVDVREVDSTGVWYRARIVWEHRELDLVLLRTEGAVIGGDLPPVRWGELVSDDPGGRPVCTVTGFPRSMRLTGSRQPKDVDGTIKPNTFRGELYAFEVDDARPESAGGWRGMSGAGVFCEDILVAVATLAAEGWRSGVLMVTPVARLLQAPGFVAALTKETGLAPRLQPADLSILLEDAPDPHLSSSYLLSPRAEVVPFAGQEHHLEVLEEWCQGPRAIDIACVTGVGGSGKTRLATELLSRLCNPFDVAATVRPWTGGFLAFSPLRPHFTLLATSIRPLLVVVDYAEARRGQLDALLSQLGARHRGGEKVRVLLLARSAGTWWRRVRRDHLEETAESAVHRELSPRLEAPHAELTRASQAFASRIALLQSARVDQGWQPLAPQPAELSSAPLQAPGDSMVDVHLTALAGVLSAPDTAAGVWKRPVDVLIKHEQRYWQRVAQDRGLDGLFAKEEGLLPMLVALQRISGARTEKEARGAVAAGLEVHHRHTTPTAAALAENAAIETMLAALYPAPPGSSARWGAMTPDVLAAELIAEVDRDTSHAFLEHVLPHPRLSEAQRSHSMTIVVRVAATQPDVERSAQAAIAAHPRQLLPLATNTLASQTTPDAARAWITGLQDALTAQGPQAGADADTRAWAEQALDAALAELDADVDTAPVGEPWDPAGPAPDDTDRQDVLRPGRSSRGRPANDDGIWPYGLSTRWRWAATGGLSVMGLLQLTFIAWLGSSAFYTSGAFSSMATLPLPPLLVLSHLAVAYLHGIRRIHHRWSILAAWLPLLAVWMATLACGVFFTVARGGATDFAMWVFWGGYTTPGLCLLALALRGWFGAVAVPSRPVPALGRPTRILLGLLDRIDPLDPPPDTASTTEPSRLV
ncbi:serine protease [Streptomyces sp. SPB4]|uniref:S1 family peptidase n=1 Tax=Streptomyces sp. SPB4 TaxID=2940553 RepID=UPI00247579CA|nr:serine protease [Streptomyces sp. SPB4]MDH6544217.1 hypothetical protein [Streptomyces sp. SPB4]